MSHRTLMRGRLSRVLPHARRLAWLITLIVSVSALPVRAQDTLSGATIAGEVRDPQGARVPGARVEVRHLDTNALATATTDEAGRFRLPLLRIGEAEVTVRAPGFAPETRVVTLTVAAAFDLPFTLRVASVSATVDVRAEAPALDTSRTQVAATLPRAELDRVPMNGRTTLDVALLVPGVSPTNLGSTQLFAETSGAPGTSLSVSGQRNFSNSVLVDGMSANDDAAGLSGQPLGLDAVEQVQVVTSGGQAELGRALAGHVNLVTRSGSNRLRGDTYTYLRDKRFNAANALSGSRLPMTQRQPGLSIGGPVVRDRTFFFGNVEGRLADQSGLTTIAPANVARINARLADVGYPGSAIATGVYPTPVDTWYGLAKVDQQVGKAARFSVRYSLYDVRADNARGAGALSAATASAGLRNRDQVLAMSSTSTLGARFLNEARVQVARGDLSAPPSDSMGPAVSIAGVASFGTLSGSPTARVNTLVQASDNLSYLRGAHAWRAGLDVQHNGDTITYPRSIRGSYAFSSLANFLSGTYNTNGFTQTFGATQVQQTNPNLGVYLQDEWKATSQLTLNLGVRYDLQWLETIQLDTNNVSPRAGFAWSPSVDRRTVVRGSAGRYFDRVPLRAVANALLSAGNTTDLTGLRQVSVSLSPGQASAPAFPNILSAPVPLVTLVNFTTMDRHLQNASSTQANLEFERQLGSRMTVSAGYQYLGGRDLIIQVNQNVPTCAAAGTNNGCRPNPTYANNSQYSSLAHSTYHGLHLSLVQRARAWGSYRVSYTLSKAMNNVGENFFSSPIDPTDLSKDWGRSDDDQRHRLVVSGSAGVPVDGGRGLLGRLARGFQVSGSLQAYSATPLNVTSGVTTVQGTAGRPVVDGAFIARNAGTGNDFFALNLRLMRTVRFPGGVSADLAAEVFNATNRVNVVTRNSVFGTGAWPGSPNATFNQVTAVGDPRAWQVALRLHL